MRRMLLLLLLVLVEADSRGMVSISKITKTAVEL